MILIVACVSFFGLGWLAAANGPALDDLARQNNTNLSGIGAIFLLSFFGGLPAQAMAGMISDRYGPRLVLMGGMILMSLSTLVFVLSHSLWLTLAINVVIGLGFGAMDVGNNIMVAEAYAGRVNIMSLLHVFFGVGAVASPAFASLSLKVWDTAIPGIWIGALIMLATVPFVYRLPRNAGRREDAAAVLTETTSKPFSYRAPLLWLLGSVMLVYVGIELGTGNWTPAYLERTTSLSKSTAALAASGFWLALSGGRIVIALIGGRFTSQRVLWMSITGSVVGAVLMAVSTGSAALSIAGVMIAGFWFGPVYPTIMGMMTRTFRNGPGQAASVAAMMGGIGGGALSWTQGVLLEEVSPAASVIFVGAGAVLMLALWWLAAPRIAQPAAPELETVPAR